ncbi:hydrogenase nickel incorporation protein HypB [Sulfuriferula plumbiphila]|nr:hydrogenase nickel incorporation protein HypB [Sulfuriferula plumbiphila]
MCTTCGCSAGETRIEGQAMDGHSHVHADGTVHDHRHEAPAADGKMQYHAHHDENAHGHRHADGTWHSHDHGHEGEHVHEHGEDVIDYGQGPAHAHAPGLTQSQMVRIEQDILGKNNAYAGRNRNYFDEHGIFALNLVSSPGSGKTTLLVRTIETLKSRIQVAVVEGDQQTSQDAERIRSTGVRALQINTGKGCHLDANMVGHALERLHPEDDSVLMIENVGNLVCPAAYDLGEAHKVVILSVTEGEDKPLKYPDMFRAASLMLLNKTDLLPYVPFNVQLAIEYAKQVNPGLHIIQTSSTNGDGYEAWLGWIETGLARQRKKRAQTVAVLQKRIQELEAHLAARG